MSKNVSKGILLAAVFMLLAFTFGCIGGQDAGTTTTLKKTVKTTVKAPRVPFMKIGEALTNKITISKVYIDKPGFIGLWNENRKLIARSNVITGEMTNVVLLTDGLNNGDKVLVMLHYDDGDGKLMFPGPDKPVQSRGTVIRETVSVKGAPPKETTAETVKKS
ncbi:MAG: hypothetical protein ABIH11_08635 [Candidatus Altiarchaeota archaeon]